MIANLVERSVHELITLKSNYEKRIADNFESMSLSTAKMQMLSQAVRAVRDELKRRKRVMS